MNFKNIKSALENDTEAPKVPESINNIKKSKMPIEKIRKSMISAIIAGLLGFTVILIATYFLEMPKFTSAVYYIFMYFIVLLSLGQMLKMISFLKKTSSLQTSTRDTLIAYIHEFQLTLEVYKTAAIARSILLPIPLAALYFGFTDFSDSLFQKIFLLDLNSINTILLISGYLLLTIIIYFSTIKSVDMTYGQNLKRLKKVLTSLTE